MRTTTLFAILVALAVAAPASAAAPRLSEDDEKYLLENDHVSVSFEGKLPKLRLAPVAAAGAAAPLAPLSAYTYDFLGVVEYRDLDGDGAPDDNEVVASLGFDNASAWKVERTTRDDAVVLNLSIAAPVELGRGGIPDGLPLPNGTALPAETASLSLVFTLRGAAATLDAGGIDVVVPATAVKYDLLVHEWPFARGDVSRLALESMVGGVLTMENETAVEGAQVSVDGTDVGALGWTTLARANTSAGAVDVPVRVAASEEGGATRLTFTYDAPGIVTLVHDPTIGILPTAAALETTGPESVVDRVVPVPGPGALAALAGVGAALVLLRRR